MKSIKGKDTKIELTLRKSLWKKDIRYRKNYNKLPGSPDIVLTKYKIVIFCDSECCHGKDWSETKLKLSKNKNSEYWINKIERNIERDKIIDNKLKQMKWTVLHFWGKDILNNTDNCVYIINSMINSTHI